MFRKLLLGLIVTGAFAGHASAFVTDSTITEEVALVSMPLAVADACDVTGMPLPRLVEVVTTMNESLVPPTQFIEVIRYIPATLISRDGGERFVRNARTIHSRGVRGREYVRALQPEIESYGVRVSVNIYMVETVPDIIYTTNEMDFFPAPVRTCVVNHWRTYDPRWSSRSFITVREVETFQPPPLDRWSGPVIVQAAYAPGLGGSYRNRPAGYQPYQYRPYQPNYGRVDVQQTSNAAWQQRQLAQQQLAQEQQYQQQQAAQRQNAFAEQQRQQSVMQQQQIARQRQLQAEAGYPRRKMAGQTPQAHQQAASTRILEQQQQNQRAVMNAQRQQQEQAVRQQHEREQQQGRQQQQQSMKARQQAGRIAAKQQQDANRNAIKQQKMQQKQQEHAQKNVQMQAQQNAARQAQMQRMAQQNAARQAQMQQMEQQKKQHKAQPVQQQQQQQQHGKSHVAGPEQAPRPQPVPAGAQAAPQGKKHGHGDEHGKGRN